MTVERHPTKGPILKLPEDKTWLTFLQEMHDLLDTQITEEELDLQYAYDKNPDFDEGCPSLAGTEKKYQYYLLHDLLDAGELETHEHSENMCYRREPYSFNLENYEKACERIGEYLEDIDVLQTDLKIKMEKHLTEDDDPIENQHFPVNLSLQMRLLQEE